MELNENIKRLRKKIGLSQELLAEKMQVSRQAVSKWETGAAKPSTQNLIELSQIFGVQLSEVIGAESGEASRESFDPESSETGVFSASAAPSKVRKAAWIISLCLAVLPFLFAAVVYAVCRGKYSVNSGVLWMGVAFSVSAAAFGVFMYEKKSKDGGRAGAVAAVFTALLPLILVAVQCVYFRFAVFSEKKIVDSGGIRYVSGVEPPAARGAYLPKGITDEELVALYNASGVTAEKPFVFLSRDYRSTGAIYAMDGNIYDELAKTSVEVDGWIALDKTKSGWSDGENTFYWSRYNNWYWETQPFVKEIDGCDFIWFSNIVGLGDSDGGWHNRNMNFIWDSGGETKSAEIYFYCEPKTLQIMNFLRTDRIGGSGFVYTIDGAMFGSFVYTGNGAVTGDLLWYELDGEKLGVVSVFQKYLPETEDVSGHIIWLSGGEITSKVYAAADSNGKYYLWITDIESIPWFLSPTMSLTGRATFCWYNREGELCQQTFVNR